MCEIRPKKDDLTWEPYELVVFKRPFGIVLPTVTGYPWLEAPSAAGFPSAGRGLAAGLFGEDSVAELTTTVCDRM